MEHLGISILEDLRLLGCSEAAAVLPFLRCVVVRAGQFVLTAPAGHRGLWRKTVCVRVCAWCVRVCACVRVGARACLWGCGGGGACVRTCVRVCARVCACVRAGVQIRMWTLEMHPLCA